MRYCNDLGLPSQVYDSVVNSGYSKGDSDFTVTELLRPHWQAALLAQHEAEVEQPVSGLLDAWLGNAVHAWLESKTADRERYVVESRFYTDVLGKRVGGKCDCFDRQTHTLYDYKTTTVASHKFGGHAEWELQLNALAYLLRVSGFDVQRLVIVAIYRDWRPSEAEKDRDYPGAKVVELPMELWGMERQAKWLEAKVAERLAALAGSGTPCSLEERWGRPSKWAVMQPPKVRAVKLCDSAEEADEYVQANPRANLLVQYRPGRSVRCESYCPVASFCNAHEE